MPNVYNANSNVRPDANEHEQFNLSLAKLLLLGKNRWALEMLKLKLSKESLELLETEFDEDNA